MRSVGMHEAKTHFSSLVKQVEAGAEVVVRRGARPVAKLVPYQAMARPRRPGALKGRIAIAPDFDEIPASFREYLGER